MPTCCSFPGKFVSAAGLLLTGLILCCLTSTALAVPPGKPEKREPHKLSNAQLHEALAVLQATKKILESADHDYGGHRVAAVRDINVAERQLHLALRSQHKGTLSGGKTGGKPGKPGKGGGKGREPQNISNLQLADAIVILEQTHVLLQKADHDYGGHREAAARDLGKAVQQLKVALTFEKKKKG
jgi:hypothetical protein